ncbi:MAG: hypothetical protein CMK89_17995 [Pseudomonadales bacterium]|nr:hypothetical protein [Pseudomonadales bacterium]
MFHENMPSTISKIVIIGLVALVSSLSVRNIYYGTVHKPWFYLLVLAGFALFLTAKLSLFIKGELLSYGCKSMAPWAANAYRVGYWFMIVGGLGTFFGPVI